MKQINISLLCLLFVFFIAASNLIAQTHLHDDEHHIKDYNKIHYSKHHIAVLNGATSNFDHHSTNYSVGIDYEYRFSQYFGVGLEGEFVAAEAEEVLGGIPFFFHPYKGDKIMVEPMLMYADAPHHETTDGHAAVQTEKETSFAIRIGTGYDFHINNFSIGPMVNFDIGKTKALVYELAIGVGF